MPPRRCAVECCGGHLISVPQQHSSSLCASQKAPFRMHFFVDFKGGGNAHFKSSSPGWYINSRCTHQAFAGFQGVQSRRENPHICPCLHLLVCKAFWASASPNAFQCIPRQMSQPNVLPSASACAGGTSRSLTISFQEPPAARTCGGTCLLGSPQVSPWAPGMVPGTQGGVHPHVRAPEMTHPAYAWCSAAHARGTPHMCGGTFVL